VILLFAITFTLVGTFAPVVYASNVPQEQVIQVNEFTAQDTTTTADQHYVCFDRTVQKEASSEIFTELYLLTDDGQRIEYESPSSSNYFYDGRREVVTPLRLPNDLVEGTYRYVLIAEFELADGRVERTLTFESEPFQINDSVDPVQSQEEAIERCGR
jgi:hypothetical protein